MKGIPRKGVVGLTVLAIVATVVLTVSVNAGSGAPAAGSDWPQWRGPNRDAKAAATGLKDSWEAAPPKLLWQASGIGLGFSSMSIVGDRIYTMGDLAGDQFVFALSRSAGKILWKTRVGPAHHDEYPGPRATPTVDGEFLYSLGTDGDLVCLSASTGQERWRRNIAREYGAPAPGWRFSESPFVDGEKLVFTPSSQGAGMVAVDKRTGKEIWRSQWKQIGPRGMDEAPYSSIVISNGAGVRQYVQLTNRGVVGVRAQDGKFLWGYNRIANNVANIPTPLVQGDYVFTSTGYRDGGSALLKLAASGGGVTATEVYYLEAPTFQNHHGGMVLVDGYVYAGHRHNNGFPICVEMATGKVVWGGDIRGPGTGSAAVLYADGDLYFRYQNGVMALIAATPSGYKLKGSFQIPQPTKSYPSWSHPVILDGKMYVREQDILFVYDVKG